MKNHNRLKTNQIDKENYNSKKIRAVRMKTL
jgi:hypothetical protein